MLLINYMNFFVSVIDRFCSSTYLCNNLTSWILLVTLTFINATYTLERKKSPTKVCTCIRSLPNGELASMRPTSHALPICSASRPTAWPHPSPYTRVDRTSLARRKLGEASGAAGWPGWPGFRQGRHARHNVGPHRSQGRIQTGSAEGKGRGRSSTFCQFTGVL